MEVARTEKTMLEVSTPMSTVTSRRRGRDRMASTTPPRAGCFSFRRKRSRGLREKREVSDMAKKATRSTRRPWPASE